MGIIARKPDIAAYYKKVQISLRIHTSLISIFVIRLLASIIWAAARDFQQCGMCDKQRLRQACAYAQSD